ncbi:Gfo/Idh/MocA family protein [Citrobacter koseri]|uniref:Gfo/Idh/MocA family protein n=1 Tax=Citrobacter koseri TaxID=545 RepID=UPI001A20E99D|nr:Gfo/Idh/MocA family oxidoreductase [Citrobacter koseri]MDI9800220.1 Gfo/Idh/MocA family oxidoreductase [Citrobacter koseri]HAT3903053.1 Gfo/Idh/MocA family oxidoreductase [Citrobacter koseri]HBC9087570.1 Gfo/Idh/MocA family oxidoreductase [Citrobacter koseri]
MKKVAVIGLGNIATRHRRNLKKLFPGIIVYAMSSSGRVLTELVSDCDGYLTNIDAVVQEQVDLVIVASPATYHLRHSQKFLAAGIPTFIEKPVTASFDDAKKLQEIAERYATPVVVGYCLRYLPSAKIIKKLIETQFIGSIYNVNIEIGQYLPDWRPSKSYCESVSASKFLGGGALLELSHELDYAQWMFGELKLVNSVLRTSSELEMDVESLADILVINSVGALINIHLDFLQKKPWRQCHIIGSKGRIVWDLIRNEVIHHTSQGSDIIFSDPDWDKNGMYTDMLLDFIAKISGNENNCVALKSSTNIVGLIDKIKETSQYIGEVQ